MYQNSKIEMNIVDYSSQGVESEVKLLKKIHRNHSFGKKV